MTECTNGCSGACCTQFSLPVGPAELQELRHKSALFDAACAAIGVDWAVANVRPKPNFGDIEQIADMVIFVEAVKSGEQFSRLPHIQANTDSATYTCRNYDAEAKLCKIYDRRPKMCSGFPYGAPCMYGCGCKDDYAPSVQIQAPEDPEQVLSPPLEALLDTL